MIVHAGATPVFADVRDADLNIDPDRVAELVTERTKAHPPASTSPGSRADLDPLLGARHPARRGRRARGRERVPRPQDRLDRRRDLLLALRDEEHRRRRGRPDRDEPTTRSREAIETCGSCAAATGRSTTSSCPATRRTSPDVLASIALVQLDKVERHGEIRRRQFALYDEAVAELDGHRAARPRPA